MVFSMFTASGSNLLPEQSGPSQPQSSMDSISLGQLKALAATIPPKPKQSFYDFRYDDQDTMFNEIEEFYSYAELPQIDENLRAWQGCFEGDWITAPANTRSRHISRLLEGLEHKDGEIRFTNARRLLYILQGTFAETTSYEHQLYWIVENCKSFRSANGIGAVKDAIKIVNSKHDLLSSWTDVDTNRFNISLQDKADVMEELCTELSIYLGMLYHVIEVMKGDDEFAEEIMALEPPLPVFLFNMLAGMKDKTLKGYPVKKLVLALWKCLLACLGGFRELARVKAIARELAELSSEGPPQLTIKATPSDIEAFRQETSIKYPTFVPRKSFEDTLMILTRQIALNDSPIPIRPHYNHYEHQPGTAQASGMGSQGAPQRVPPPATPAPSPPPSPKPKKQQYQTDQGRPFLFPFNPRKTGTTVPFAIDEADRLYGKHVHVSVANWQTWRTREDYISDEAGLSTQYEHSQAGFKESLIDSKVSRIEQLLADPSGSDNRFERNKLKERKEDLLRLKRVELLYVALLPVLGPCATQMLKMVLATVTASTNQQNPQSATSANFPGHNPSPDSAPAVPNLSLEEIDVIRHREITNKAVSAILLLTLKWFKVSHVMKFHHFGLLLLDSNCILLILKMFGLQEVTSTVTSKCDSPDHNFFRYCHLAFSRNPRLPRQEERFPSQGKQSVTRVVTYPSGQKVEEEVELLTDFSWRNFFATINYVRIMQKLTKRRSHRIWLLVQYKSSGILKRVLKVSHPLLQLHVLKLIKSQVPYCGRKWRQTNMKVITQIYLNCRPDLRDEWLTGSEIEDINEVMSQEQALRSLVKYYNTKHYGRAAQQAAQIAHKRSISMHGPDGLYIGPELANFHRPAVTPITEMDVFPPLRSHAPDPSIFLPYIPEDIAFEEEYEEYLSDLGITDQNVAHLAGEENGADIFGHAAWTKLAELPNMADNISDSESVISIGDLGEELRQEERESRDENRNDWEHMSPKTMAALPKSPAGGNRRSSSGAHLRPVIPFDLDEGSALDDEDEQEDSHEMGPMPIEGASFGAAEGGRGVDEVEFMYHE